MCTHEGIDAHAAESDSHERGSGVQRRGSGLHEGGIEGITAPVSDQERWGRPGQLGPSGKPGVIGVEVVDLLTGEQCFVREVSGSRNAVARDAVLARVVRIDEYAVFCGIHPQPLTPQLAADVRSSSAPSSGSSAPGRRAFACAKRTPSAP